MSASFFGCVLLFALTSCGLGWPIVARATLQPAEKLLAAVASSWIALYAIAWATYVFAWPTGVLGILPLLAAAGLFARWRELRAAFADADVRSLAIAQVLVTAWCVGWLATTVTYSGGGWAGDWFEHWERTRFFLDRWPRETKFLGTYALTARPPLANLVTGAFLAVTRIDFAHYQLVCTLCASLAFLPAGLLALRWSTRRAIAVLAVLVMLNPLFVQNATFAWTKLPAAFFVLSALYFFWRAQEPMPARAAAPLCGACLAAAMLAHYSAGPYLVMLAIGWLVLGWPRRTETAWWRRTGTVALAGSLLLATWLGWALATFGAEGTLFTNSSVTSSDARQGNQLIKIALNLFDTIVPHFLRASDDPLIAQTSPWGRVHDWFFQTYQVNLLFAFGSVAWLVIARELVRCRTRARHRVRAFWITFISGVVLLGTAAHGQRDHWGLVHICLQALVILGLAWLAASWPELTVAWRIAAVVGAIADFAAGIVLHFAVQNLALERWFAPGRLLNDSLSTWSQAAQMNLVAKVTHQLRFFADDCGAGFGAIAPVLAGLLALAVWRARTARDDGLANTVSMRAS